MEDRFDEVMEFRRSLNPETDRGCALMAAAYLDSEIDRTLRLYVVANIKIADEFFGQGKPAGTFSSRIDLAFLLGLITSNGRRDLHLIRKIRNDFGHVHRPLIFDNPAIASRCRELMHHFRDNSEAPRSIFISSAVGALAMLHTAMNNLSQLTERPEPNMCAAKIRQAQLLAVMQQATNSQPDEDGGDN